MRGAGRAGARLTRLAAVMVAVGVAAAAAGCVSIPRSSAVRQGQTLGSGGSGVTTFDYLPPGPRSGASQEEILSGFLEAAVSPQQSYAVAREYLTPSLGSTWRPDAQVTVDSSTDRTPRSTGPDSLEVTLSPVAYVDGDGSYRQADPGARITQPYRFVRLHGQWRIAKAPDGIVIDSAQFANVFSSRTLYFFDPSYRFLVPDERWFPTRVSTPTRVVDALLAGPADWLKGAVVSALPADTKLANDAVTVSDGTALVDLDAAADQATSLGLERVRFQLSQSLQDASTVSAVRVAIEGQVRQIGDLGSASPVIDPQVSSDPVVALDGRLGLLASSGSVTPLQPLSDRLSGVDPVAVVVSADRQTAAALSSSGVSVTRGGDPSRVVDDRRDLVPPALDPAGWVYSETGAPAEPVTATPTDGAAVSLASPWTGATRVLGLALSRDGTRLAALVATADGPHLEVSGVQRDDDGSPRRLGAPADLGVVAGGEGRSLAWVDELTVGVLTGMPDGATTVTSAAVGGPATSIDGPHDGVQLAGGAVDPAVWVLSRSGSVLSPRGTGWQVRADGASVLGTQLGTPSG